MANTSLPPPLIQVTEDITRLIVVIIPTLILSSFLFYHLHGLMKTFDGMKPLAFLYVCVAILCNLGPISYSTVSVIHHLRFPYAADCSAIDAISTFIFFVGHTMLCFSIGLIAVVQFMSVDPNWKMAVSVRKVAVACIVILVVVLSSNATFYGVLCVQLQGRNEQVRTAVIVWALLIIAIALAVTILSSVLTYMKVKGSIILQSEDSKILRSIALVSAFNVMQFVTMRVFAIVLYIFSYVIPGENAWFFNEAGLLVGDISYPLTVLSIFVVHNKLRRAMCCKGKNLYGTY